MKKIFKKYRFYLSIFVLSFILGTVGLILNEKEANKGAEIGPMHGQTMTGYYNLPEASLKPKDLSTKPAEGVVLSVEEEKAEPAAENVDNNAESEEIESDGTSGIHISCGV